MKMLTVFIDGLKPESIEYMPFLSTFGTKRRVKTELGYSVGCHASMYSGVYPNKHLRWFLWRYSPETSPCRWIKQLKIDKIPQNFYTKYSWYKLAKFFNRRNTSYYDLPMLWQMPLKYWPYFDMTEKKFWSEPGFLEKYPTIFDIFRNNNIPYETVGLVRKDADRSSKIIENHLFSEIKSWTYLFVGDIDPLSHKYGQDSVQLREKLKEIDKILEKKYGIFEKECRDFYFMVFSDHGHIKIKEKVNLKSFFDLFNESLDNYIHFIDANYARFWFRTEEEKRRVSKVLSEMSGEGFILTEEHYRKYNVNMPDNRYGDLIFYLDAPYTFDQGVNILGKKRGSGTISGHGYLPDHQDSDGILVSNKNVIKESYVRLVDILPSILKVMGIQIPAYIDGEALWK